MSETSFCKNCKRDVPAASFTLHVTHCERFMQICSKCEEPVNKAHMELHEKDIHSLVNCKDCKQQIEKGKHDKHTKKDCPRRLIPCKFCEVDCVAAEIEEHEIPCGSRTEKCDICGNHILVRMLKAHEELHKQVNSVGKAQVSSSNNLNGSVGKGKQIVANVGNNDSPVNYPLEEHSFPKFRNVICQNIFQASAAVPTDQQNEIQRRETSQKNDNVDRKKESTYYFGKDDEDPLFIPCEFCGEPCAIEILEEHQLLCNSKVERCRRCDEILYGQSSCHACSSRGPPVSSAVEEEYWSRYPPIDNTISDDEPTIPCETCNNLFPISCLELHEIACKFSEVSTSDTMETGPKIDNISKDSQHLTSVDEDDYWSNYPTGSATAGEHMDGNEISIPCEFCEELFPVSCLKMHEVACGYGKEFIDENDAGVNDSRNAFKPPGDALRPPLDEILPCSFCSVAIPSSILDMHEARCSRLPSQNRSPAVVPKRRKNPVVNNRPESANQRALRENALSASENRLLTNPRIQQSQYTVVELPDGQQILKKRNPSSNTNYPYVGHVLGRGSPYKSINDDPPVHSVTSLPKAHYFERRERRMHTEPDPVPNTNVPVKPLVDRDAEKRISKKPNASFANYAYQPDPGHRLGREGNSTTITPHSANGAIPRTRLGHDNRSMNRQPEHWDGTTQEFHNARDRGNYEATAAHVKPKRPSQSRNNF